MESLALMFNNRDWEKSPFIEAHQRLLEEISPGYKRGYRDVDFFGEVRASDLFEPGEKRIFEWLLPMTVEAWVGLGAFHDVCRTGD